MTRQLALLDILPEWQIDPQTREIGLQGIARARAVLAAAGDRTDDASAEADPSPIHHRPAA